MEKQQKERARQDYHRLVTTSKTHRRLTNIQKPIFLLKPELYPASLVSGSVWFVLLINFDFVT